MIFEEQISREPNHYPWAKEFIQAIWDNPWNDKEFTFSSDKHDFHTKLTAQEREVITRALSGISQIEISVKDFWSLLGFNLPHPALKDLGTVMAAVEVVHTNAYERLLKELDIEEVFSANLKIEFLNNRVNYLRKHAHKYYENSKKQFLYSLILFTLFVENVSLFSQFYIINWFGRKNLLKDTNQQTAYTAREEDLHAKTGIQLINTIKKEHPELFDDEMKAKIKHESLQAFKAEKDVIKWTVNGTESDHMSEEIVQEFIKNRFNESLEEIGCETVFEVDQEILKKTIWFDELILGNNSTDFFNAKPVEYSEGGQSFDVEDLYKDGIPTDGMVGVIV